MIQGRQLEEYILQQGVVDVDMPIVVVKDFCSLYACTNRLNIVAIDFDGWLDAMKLFVHMRMTEYCNWQ